MLRDALKYEALGLSIIPLRPKAKEPLYPWTEFQKRRATPPEITKWWSAVPNANIGIVTGKVSGIAVVDLDGPEGLLSAKNIGLNSQIISLTGNGKHLWYRAPKDVVTNAVRIYPGVDVRGEGGYIVAPASISPNGKRYRWLGRGVKNVEDLPLFPQYLLTPVSSVSTDLVVKQEGWIAKALEEMKIGNIDNTLTSICGRLRHDGYSRDDCLALLTAPAMAAGAEKGHLEEKIENIWKRYKPKPIQYRSFGSESMGSESQLIIHTPTNPDSIKQYEQLYMPNEATEITPLFTGYTKLDAMLYGGLKSSRLFTLAARTGVGKTNWLISVAREICRTGRSVLLFSTEMPYTQIWKRYIAALDNPKEFETHKFYVCDSFAPNLEKVEEAINEIKPDVFMFDHINHVSEEQRELGAFMQGLNYLRRKYDCAGVVTAQLNRSADWIDLKSGEKVTPRMSMIKGSGTIEQASSRVLLLTETRVTPEYTEIVGNLDKNDNGDKGLVHFGLYKQPYRMIEL